MSEAATAHRSPLRLSLDRFRRNRLAMVCLGFAAFVVVACIAGPWLHGIDYKEQDRRAGAQPPSLKHLFGTDTLGRDLLVRCLIGGRISLAVGVVGALVSVCIGVTYGAVAGYAGGRLGAMMMRCVDVLYGLPYLLFVVLIMTVLGTNITPTERILAMFLALGAVQWLTMARIVRGEVVALKEKEFVEAARAVGAGRIRIVFRHLVPNLIGLVVVYATLTIPAIMLQEAFLTFLGLGVKAPLASWGSLITDAADVIDTYWWMVVFPGALFTSALFALNFIGDGLRDAFDPQMQR